MLASTHIATRLFQAFRIFVNNELNELYTGLKTAQVSETWWSTRCPLLPFMEDRIIKRFLLGISMTERFNLSARQKVIQKSQLDSYQENKRKASFYTKGPFNVEIDTQKVPYSRRSDVQDNPEDVLPSLEQLSNYEKVFIIYPSRFSSQFLM